MAKCQINALVNVEKAGVLNFEHESFGFFSNFGHTKF